MRAILAMFALCVAAVPVAADTKTKELARDYERELTGCQARADGAARVTNGTQALVDAGQAQHAADLATLRGGLAQLQAYCAELIATLGLLTADPNASYRSIERKLDDHDNKIRKFRQGSKKVLDDLAPVISRMIPQINARNDASAPPEKRVRVRFPSGRAIGAPVLAGTYRASGGDAVDVIEYAEAKLSVMITAKLVAATTCEQQRRALTAKDASDVSPTDATRSLGLAWYVAYTRDPRWFHVACRDTKGGAMVATLDEPAAGGLPDFELVLASMIAARP